jgi:hypothetical protein
MTSTPLKKTSVWAWVSKPIALIFHIDQTDNMLHVFHVG